MRQKQKGAAFVEFIMVFAMVILPMTVFTLNIGRLLWQTQALSDFAREGVREIGRTSDILPQKNCDYLQDQGIEVAGRLLESNRGWQLSNIWEGSVGYGATRTFRAGDPDGPAAKIKTFVVGYKTIDDDTCLFCMENLFSKFDIFIYAIMDISSKSQCMNE